MLLQGIVPILHGSLLNHLTVVIKVGASYTGHMNYDVPEVGSFSQECYQRRYAQKNTGLQGTIVPVMTTGFGPFELLTHGLLQKGRDHSSLAPRLSPQ